MKVKGMRWWIVCLLSGGLVINYLARNTLSVAAPTMMTQLDISTGQYSHTVIAWHMTYAFMQPVVGYVIDAIGTKLGLAIFDIVAACVILGVARGAVRPPQPPTVETQGTSPQVAV